MIAIEAKGLSKQFNKRTAVDKLDLAVEQGEFFALLGLNGAGKTTTIKMLSCLLQPTAGEAWLLGDSILSAPQAVKQKINVSPQETAVARKLSVQENLEMIAAIYGSDRADARRRAQDKMAQFGLADRANEQAKKLSGGLERRLSIAMAMISEPSILFLDEPTLGLDVRARRDLWKLLQEAKHTMTIVLTTHYMEEAQALADRIGVLHNGKLCALGTAQALMDQTNTTTLDNAFLALTDAEVE